MKSSWTTRISDLGVIVVCCLLLALPLSSTQAQTIAPITPSGLNTQVSTPVNLPSGKVQYDITGGTRPGGGVNLFHSFGDFNVPNNNIANFLNDTPTLATSNILGRVTGGNLSNIFGTIQTTGFGNANLFLMNPAGFLFGPNATVNVGGMVAFTSADYLRLEGTGGNGIFHADPAKTSILTSAPVAAYGFLGSNPGAITVQGSQFTVTEGTGISLVGGNIIVQSGVLDDGITNQPARLTAPGGQINFASVASPGEILFPTLQSAPNVNGQSFTAMGNINLSEGSTLDVSDNAAGTIAIRGGNLVIADATLSANTGNSNSAPVAIDINLTGDLSISDTRAIPAITATSSGSGNAGEVQIVAANVQATTTDPDFVGFPLIDSHSSGDGRAGNVSITTGNLTVAGPAATWYFIDSGPQGNGHGGDVTITASNHIQLDGTYISTGTQEAELLGLAPSTSSGKLTITADSLQATDTLLDTHATTVFEETQFAGDITLNIRDINVVNTLVSAFGNGGGAAITINADRLVADNTQFQGFNIVGPGKGITFTGDILELTNGSSFNTSTFGDLGAGNILVTATDHVSLLGITGANPLGEFNPSGLFSNAFFGGGAAGNITVTTPRLTMREGRINTSTATSGPGGNVTINASVIEMSGEFPNPDFGGFFGITNIHPSGIFTQTVGSEFCSGPCGNAGNINITTGSLLMGDGSQINSGTTSNGRGGDITIQAVNQIGLSGTLTDGSPVGIFSRTIGTDPGSGDGGNIELHAAQLQVTNGAHISASTLGSGNAGNVILEGPASPAQSVLINGEGSGVFTDTHATGTGGNISVDSNSVTLQNGGTLSAATSGTAPSATGGTITVNAGQVALNSQALITADTNGIAPAGTVDINTGSLAINSGGQIRSSSGAGQALVAALAAAPTLTGGTITVEGQGGAGTQAGSVTIDGTGSGIFTQSSGNRPGGDINILTSGSVTMTNGASISASSTGTGNAGNIQINAGNQLAMTNSTVTTEANQSGGGIIKITTNPNGTVKLTNSMISASVLDGNGGGGSVNIDPQFVILQNSQILAQAVQGPGGNISITTNLLLPDANSTISASSQFGQQGTISIQSPIAPAGGKIAPMSQKPLLATTMFNQRCAALAGGNFSTFTVAGRDSVPAEPGGWLSSPLALATLSAGSGQEARGEGWKLRTQNPELITEEPPLLSLRHIAPPGFLTQSFAVDPSGCQS